MRLIDADALLKAFYRELDNAILYGRIVKPLQDLINEAPTVDAMPVVRCKDCKHCNTDWAMGKWYGSCKEWNTHSVMADWYCVNGERKDDDRACDTCKYYDKWWDDIVCDGCTKAYSNWERRDDE